MNSTPLVTIIINCFNGEKYVRGTLDSIFAQSYKNYELIFWDNCSTDNTPSIVESYNDERIQYYRADVKTTLGKARNLAMEKAHGDYISFIDADDIWLPDFLTLCVEVFNMHSDASIAYTRFINFDGDNEWLSPGSDKNRKISPKELISSYGIGMSGAMFNKRIKENYNIKIDERFSLIEDYDFFIHLSAYGDVYYIAQPQMRYRWNPNGLTQNSKWAEENKMLYDKVKEEDILSLYANDIRKIYECVQTRDYLLSGEKSKALCLICKSMWRNRSILRYIFPVVFGMELFHKLRMRVSKS